MIERLTSTKDINVECRINFCEAEDWIAELTDGTYPDYVCEKCPFMEYINKLAEYEDNAERMEDDLK